MLLRFAAAIAIVMAAVTACASSSRYSGEPDYGLILVLGSATLAGVALWVAFRAEFLSIRLLLNLLRPRSGDVTRGVALGIAAMVGAWALTRWVATPTTPREAWVIRVYLQLGEPEWMRAHVPVVVFGIAVIAVSEELLFRGLVTLLLERRFGWRHAWLATALLYAVAHIPAAWMLRDPVAGINPLVFLGTLGTGMLWGAATHMTQRLIPAIFGHAVFACASVLMFRLWGPSV